MPPEAQQMMPFDPNTKFIEGQDLQRMLANAHRGDFLRLSSLGQRHIQQRTPLQRREQFRAFYASACDKALVKTPLEQARRDVEFLISAYRKAEP